VDRSAVATKKLASRARRKVQGAPRVGRAELARHRRVVEAFLAASRAGDVTAVAALLAPGVVRHADPATLAEGRAAEVRGRSAVVEEIVGFGANARFATVTLVDGDVGIVVAPRGRVTLAIRFAIAGESIAAYELVAGPTRLEHLDVALLAPVGHGIRVGWPEPSGLVQP
jgi:RNA polymerase sigma-70 factor (ECF subfamily)